MTTTTRVTAINSGHGNIKIHKPGCRDIKRNARGASIWDIDATCLRDIVWDVYPPVDFSYDAETEWTEFAGDIEIMACCPKLDNTVIVTPAAATRTYSSHANCDHDRTPRGRAACRKAGGPKA